MLHGRICQLCEEDILRAFHQTPAHFHGAAEGCLPERKVEHMVKSERNQRTLHETVHPGSCITGFQHHAADGVDALLNHRPDKEHQDSHHRIGKSADDGHESGAAEEGQYLRQFDFVKFIMKGRHTQTDDDTAEHAHLQ